MPNILNKKININNYYTRYIYIRFYILNRKKDTCNCQAGYWLKIYIKFLYFIYKMRYLQLTIIVKYISDFIFYIKNRIFKLYISFKYILSFIS